MKWREYGWLGLASSLLFAAIAIGFWLPQFPLGLLAWLAFATFMPYRIRKEQFDFANRIGIVGLATIFGLMFLGPKAPGWIAWVVLLALAVGFVGDWVSLRSRRNAYGVLLGFSWVVVAGKALDRGAEVASLGFFALGLTAMFLFWCSLPEEKRPFALIKDRFYRLKEAEEQWADPEYRAMWEREIDERIWREKNRPEADEVRSTS